MRSLSFALVLTIILFSCKSKKNIESSANEKPFSDEMVANINKRYPGVTADQLITGEALYRSNCKKCHGLKKPENFTEAQWNKIMPDMAKKAKIEADTEAQIMRYLLALSKEG